MTEKLRAPKATVIEYFQFLDQLRKSGVTNMFGSPPYIEAEFGVTRKLATAIFLAWSKTFSDRPVEERADEYCNSPGV